MLYQLSRVIPVPMTSFYKADDTPYVAQWWQWRGRIYLHRVRYAVHPKRGE